MHLHSPARRNIRSTLRITLLLSLVTAAPSPLAASAGEFVQTADSVASFVNVRSRPGTEAPKVGRLERGTKAELVRRGAEWHAIKLPDQTLGYVSARWSRIAGQGTAFERATIAQREGDSGVHVLIHHEFVEIIASSLAEVAEQLAEAAEAEGRHGLAATTWTIGFNRSGGIEGSCGASTVATTTIRHRLPRWNGKTDAPETEQEKWERFLAALEEHERGHKDIAIRGAVAVEEAISALPHYEDCGAFAKAAKQANERIKTTTDSLQAEYDRKTEHGVLQGALLDP